MGYDGGEHGRVIVDDVIQETKNVEMTHRKCHKGLPWQKATPSFCGTFQVQVLGFRREYCQNVTKNKSHRRLSTSVSRWFHCLVRKLLQAARKGESLLGNMAYTTV